jgi:hypothetical protein
MTHTNHDHKSGIVILTTCIIYGSTRLELYHDVWMSILHRMATTSHNERSLLETIICASDFFQDIQTHTTTTSNTSTISHVSSLPTVKTSLKEAPHSHVYEWFRSLVEAVIAFSHIYPHPHPHPRRLSVASHSSSSSSSPFSTKAAAVAANAHWVILSYFAPILSSKSINRLRHSTLVLYTSLLTHACAMSGPRRNDTTAMNYHDQGPLHHHHMHDFLERIVEPLALKVPYRNVRVQLGWLCLQYLYHRENESVTPTTLSTPPITATIMNRITQNHSVMYFQWLAAALNDVVMVPQVH